MTQGRWDDEPVERWDEAEEDADLDADEDEAELVECPSCGEPVYEDAEQCPACGEYIVHSTSPFSTRQPWTVALFLVGVVAVIIACIVLF
jgi:hypothetical protein